LKSSPLKQLKSGAFRAKERVVLNIINYFEEPYFEFNESTFWKKNSYILFVFYLFVEELTEIDRQIKLVDYWKFPEEDLLIIKHDWNTIVRKIKEGKAHEISEGDTFYLGACTKGSTTVKSLRKQPFSSTLAKQRAYSLKQGYVNHIIAKISHDKVETYGKIVKRPDILSSTTLEELVVSKFEEHYGKSPKELVKTFNISLNAQAKNYIASLTKAILGIELNKRIEEFEKADIIVKSIRLDKRDIPAQNLSFPAFKYEEIIQQEWEDSDLFNMLSKKFFFVFYQHEEDALVLRKVKFWNMPMKDIEDVKIVWDKTIDVINKGNIVKEVTNNKRYTYFPNLSENRICHVRPHANATSDTYPLPVKDIYTGATEYSKHCFWLNKGYIKASIFEE
ncbi:MAG: DNA mismatch repair protein, partial [Candidatus Cloacimonetes bacterium]|nr:DNA mismatch repair protein [Candidatus Cloacimonadota bacterium]